MQRKTMRLMLLHFEHSHDLSLKAAFDKLKNHGMQRMEKVELPRSPLNMEQEGDEKPAAATSILVE